MKDIKLKAFNKETKKIITTFVMAPTSPTWSPFLIRNDDKVNSLVNSHYKKFGDDFGGDYSMLDWTDWYGIENLNVYQFSGKLDRNGIEIYDGDTCKIYRDKNSNGSDAGMCINEKSKISFENCSFCYSMPVIDGSTENLFLGMIESENIEIIKT